MASIKCTKGHTHRSVTEVRTCSTRTTCRPADVFASNNPWEAKHAQDELAYTGGEYTRTRALSMVANEYDGMRDAITCGRCQQPTAFYRATVGAYQCTSCGSLRCPRYNKETGKSEIRWTDPR